MARVVVNDLQEGVFRPTQTAGDTYGGYDKPVINNDMGRLAEALGVAQQAVGAFVRPRNDAEIYRWMSTNPNDAVGNRAAGEANRGVLGSGWSQGAYHPALVTQAAENDAKNIVQRYQEGLKSGIFPVLDDNDNPIDHQAKLAELAKQHYEGPGARFANNTDYTKKFFEVTQSTREGITQTASEAYANAIKERWQGPVQQGMAQIIKGAEAPDVTDETLRNVVNTAKAEIKNRAGVVISWRTLDDLMMGQLRTLAQQNPAAVIRILDLDRGVTGEGVKLGSLGNPVGRHAQAANEIRLTAFKELEKRYDTDIREQRITQIADAVSKGNSLVLDTLKDETYDNPYFSRANPGRTPEPRTLKADELKAEVINRSSTSALQEFRDQGLDPETAGRAKFDRDFRLYVGQNVVNPEWKGVISGAVTIYGNPTAVSIPGNYEKLRQARQLYETLNTNAPGYLEKTLGLTKEDREFFDRVRVYQNIRGMDEREAMMRASNVRLQQQQEPLSGAETKNIEQKAANLDLSWWPMYGSGANVGRIKRDIMEVAKTLVADRDLAGNLDAVMKEAEKIVRDRSVLFNGRVVTGDPYITPESMPFWKMRLREITQQYGGIMMGYDGNPVGVTDADTLSVRPMAGGKYYQVIRANGEPMSIPIVRNIDGKNVVTGSAPLTIEPREINMIRQRVQDETDLENQRLAVEAPARAIIGGSIPGLDKNKYFEPATPSREDILKGLTDPTIRQKREADVAEARKKLNLLRYGSELAPWQQPGAGDPPPGIWGDMSIGQPPHMIQGN